MNPILIIRLVRKFDDLVIFESILLALYVKIFLNDDSKKLFIQTAENFKRTTLINQ